MKIEYEHKERSNQVKLVSHKDINAIFRREFGRPWTEYRKKWEKASSMDSCPEFPLSLDFETNNSCNFRCNMCFFSDNEIHPDMKKGLKTGYMSMPLFRKMIDEGKKYRLPAITFGFCSEPLLHKNIAEMVAYARSSGVFDIRLGTNGSLLDEKMARDLIDAGLTRLEVSIDAIDEETYNKIRKGGDYKRLIENIHRFLKLRDSSGSLFPLLRVSFLKLNLNEGQLEPFLEYWQQYADYFSIQQPIDYELKIGESELKFKKVVDKTDYHCSKIFQRMYVRFNGIALPCGYPFGWDEFNMGDLHQISVYSAWHNRKFQKLRNLQKNGEYYNNNVCKECVRHTNLEG